MSIYKSIPAFNSYEEIPSSFRHYILDSADAEYIEEIPLSAINEFMHNMSVDKFFTLLGEKFAYEDYNADNNVMNSRY